jgi:hypothetical protein
MYRPPAIISGVHPSLLFRVDVGPLLDQVLHDRGHGPIALETSLLGVRLPAEPNRVVAARA